MRDPEVVRARHHRGPSRPLREVASLNGRVAFGVTTRNRPESLRACLDAIAALWTEAPDILVFDDASVPPAAPAGAASRVRVIRSETAVGPTAGRNRLVEEARTPFVMLLDDDARPWSRESVEAACDVLERDRLVAVVAFAQAETDGRPWPASMQPAPVTVPSRVRAFIGFAHLVRRDVFRALGGYQALLGFYGEEKEFSLRILDAGYSVVYLPDARVVHAPDPSGRQPRKYLRAVVRNDCLNTMLNDPWWRVVWMLPARAALYFRMRRVWRVSDPGGFWWLLRELWRELPAVRRERRPVRNATLRRWRQIGVTGEPYVP